MLKFGWIEGTKFCYINGSNQKSFFEGTEIKQTSATKCFAWIEGTKLSWIGQSDRKKYQREGILVCATAATKCYGWVDGSYIYYIDQSRDKRYISLGIEFPQMYYAYSVEAFDAPTTWATIWAQAIADDVTTHHPQSPVVYYHKHDWGEPSGLGVTIYRAGIYFNTTALPAEASINAARLYGSIYTVVGSYPPGVVFTSDYMRIVRADNLSYPAIAADYGYLRTCDAVVASSPLMTSSDTEPTLIGMELDANGIAGIVPEGMTCFGVRSGRDVDNDEPLAETKFTCRLSSDTVLIVEYS